MKRSISVIISVLSILSVVRAQDGKVGINTTAPKNTLHINGDVRVDTIQETLTPKHLLTTDDSGVIQKIQSKDFRKSNANKLIAWGEVRKSEVEEIGNWLTLTYENVDLDDASISYNDKGVFTMKKAGYYFINVYCNVYPDPDPNDKQGIIDLNIKKMVPIL